MSIRSIIQGAFSSSPLLRTYERLSGTRVLKKLPVGIDLFADIRYTLPKMTISTIVDVGANIGQSEEEFVHHFPKASIYCIEPHPNTFDQLKKNVIGQHTKCFNIGLDATGGTLYLNAGVLDESVSFTFQRNDDQNGGIPVEVMTLGQFATNNAIKQIDLLKIDTEGLDLRVLQGAEDLLKDQKINLIQVEASMNSSNEFHVHQAEFIQYMDKLGYLLFGVYDQIHDFVLKEPILRRANLVFISPSVYK
ncbi:MAG: FkbM family methyltransferase [Deltaproteobacteria bacterium]|nr:MAG: FkbM family methyltransferase [Deltaproteobacteria bacterium]